MRDVNYILINVNFSCNLTGWFWLEVTHEAAGETLTGAAVSTYIAPSQGGQIGTFSPHSLSLGPLECPPSGQLASPRVNDPRDHSDRQKLQCLL